MKISKVWCVMQSGEVLRIYSNEIAAWDYADGCLKDESGNEAHVEETNLYGLKYDGNTGNQRRKRRNK